MSRFGDNNFRSDIFEELPRLAGEEPLEQLDFLHRHIKELATNGFDFMHPFVINSIQEWNLTTIEALEGLGEVYTTVAARDLVEDD